MRNRRPRKREEEQILPLINIVFLLLILFMLAGRLAVSDPFGIMPPESTSEAPAGTEGIVVTVSAAGRLALDGAPIDEIALERAVVVRITETGAREVSLRADGRAPAIRIVALMETLRRAGVERMHLLTVPQVR